MTYGWAIIIIAVVLGVLFQLGIFNASFFSPRASPGSCKIQRTTTPGGTVSGFVGACKGQLPQYAANFNGQTSFVSISSSAAIAGNAPFTKAVWVYLPAGITTGYIRMDIFCWGNYGSADQVNCLRTGDSNNQLINYFWGDDMTWSPTHLVSGWNQIAVTYDGANEYGYVNGVQEGSRNTPNANVAATALTIAKGYSGDNQFKGYISNLQLYNASLPTSEISALYLAGLGAAPLDLTYLVGWWPLNGDANDYSGNNNNGVPTGVSFTTQYGK